MTHPPKKPNHHQSLKHNSVRELRLSGLSIRKRDRNFSKTELALERTILQGPWTPFRGFQRPPAFGGVEGQSPSRLKKAMNSKRLFPYEAFAAGAVGLYRLAGWAGTPAVRLLLRRRLARGREDAERLGERWGQATATRPPGPLLWIHAASVGESLSALPLVARLRAERPELGLLVTTGSVTSARLMGERLPEGAVHQYLPVDLPGPVRRFLDHWQPSLGLFVESEFWPSLLTAARARRVTLVLVNGRMSLVSFAWWRRARPLIGRLLGNFYSSCNSCGTCSSC